MVIWSVCAGRACLHDQDVAKKKKVPGDSEARGGVGFSRALPAALVKFKRLGWQTARFLTLALGSSLRLMDYRSEPGRLTVILARSLKGALIYYREKRKFWTLEDVHLPCKLEEHEIVYRHNFTVRASEFKDCVQRFFRLMVPYCF